MFESLPSQRSFSAAAWFSVCIAVLLYAACSPTTSEEGEPAIEGLVARYDFDEGSGTVLRDRSGHGLDGTLKGGAEWQSGLQGTALGFNGIDGYVELPRDSAFLLDSFTVAAWIRPTNQGPNDRVIFSNLESTEPPEKATGGMEFRFRLGQLNCTTAGARFNGNWTELLRPTALADSSWHWVAVRVAGGFGTLWIDGAQAGVAQAWGKIAHAPSSPQIGACLRNWADKGYFNGRIDDLRIYSRGLTDGEMSSIYNLNRPAP